MENLLKMLLLLAILHSVLGFSSSGDQDAEKDGVDLVSPLLRNVRMDRKMFVRIGRAPMREMVRLGRSQEENTEDM